VDGAVAFRYESLVKAGFLKLTVDITREDRGAARHILSPTAEYLEAIVRHGAPIELESVTIESPAELRGSD
jgi:hypothetical protein